jgi:hypothetical protein
MKNYLLIAFLLCFTPLAFATNFIRDDTTYHTDRKSSIKNKVRTKYYKGGLAKKQKLKDELKGWEEVDA